MRSGTSLSQFLRVFFPILAVSGVRDTSFDIKIRNKFIKIKYIAPYK